MSTRRPAAVVLLTVTAICAASCTRGPKGLSRDAYEATEEAVAALRRANEYRDAAAEGYEVRILDAEKALNALEKAQTNPPDSAVSQIVRSCVEDLGLYRHTRESEQMSELHQRIGAEINQCIATAHSYL
jgi:thiamine biosynthesis lipoprotein ApbE